MKKLYTIGICGPSCSGKTTIARILKKILKNVTIIHQDDFYKPDKDIPVDKETQLKNWDCPEAVDFNMFLDIIVSTKKNQGKLPIGFDSKEEANVHDGSNMLENDTECKLQEILIKFSRDDCQFIIVDGFMLFRDKRILDQFDFKIRLTSSYKTLKNRREERQGYKTECAYWIDPPGYFDKIVWPEYLRLDQYTPLVEYVLEINTDIHSIRDMSLIVAERLGSELH